MEENVTNKDLYTLIQALVTKTNNIETQNTDIKNSIAEEIGQLKTELAVQFKQIKEETLFLREENKILKEKIVVLEKQTRKYNLVFYGLEEKEKGNRDLQNFLNLLNDKVQISCRREDIRDFRRIGSEVEGKSRPVKVEFVSFFIKHEILTNTRRFKGTNIYVSPEYTTEEYAEQKILREHLRLARDNNHKAVIRKKTLIVNGKEYNAQELKDKQAYEAERETEVIEKNRSQGEQSRNHDSIQREELKYLVFETRENKKRRQEISEKENIDYPSKRVTRNNREQANNRK